MQGNATTLIPYFTSQVPAGFPSPAQDYLQKRIDLNDAFIRHPLSTFMIECEGTSMTNAFIAPKSRLLIDKSIAPQNGDIVLAVLNGEFTVKYLKKNERQCFLVPANCKFKEIEITPEMEFQVWGVVVAIITNPNDIKCML